MNLSRPARQRIGWALTIAGCLAIVAGVFYVLNAVGYAEDREFAQRRSYDQVKVAVHESYPIGFAIGVAGLALAMLGAHVRRGGPGEGSEED